jgi:pheromone shutdown protein TraB
MITLIGVGHVFNIRRNIETLITERNPSVVCVELDKFRYEALISKQRSDGGPLVYQMLSRFQKKMAEKYGVDVGEEMLGAIKTAEKIGAKLAFIDVDASFVFERFWSSMSFSEKIKLMVGQDNSDEYMETFSKEFPTIKEELIDKRDAHMAKAIRAINKEHTNVVAVIGDGHIMGVKKALADLNLEVIRLDKVRNMKLPPTQKHKSTTREVSFSYTYSDKKNGK